MEVWKNIPSLPEYEASSWGLIRRRLHEKLMPNGGTRIYGGKPITGAWEKTARRYVVQFRGKTYRVARLICEAFHGLAPEGKPVCMHLDEDSRNNRPGNLVWGTQRENLNAPGFIAYCRSRTGENSPTIKGKRRRCGAY